jgi:aquaporin Z
LEYIISFSENFRYVFKNIIFYDKLFITIKRKVIERIFMVKRNTKQTKSANNAKKQTITKKRELDVIDFYEEANTYQSFDKPLFIRALSEGFGSFILVLICLYGAVILPFFMFSMPQQSQSGSGAVDFTFYLRPLSIILSAGLAAFLSFATLGKISGGHFNPALSIASAICRRVRWSTAGIYILAQAVGAGLAAVVIRLIMPVGQVSEASQSQIDLSVNPTAWFRYGANGFGANSTASSLFGKNIGLVFNVASALILELLAIAIITVAFISITKRVGGKHKIGKAATIGLAYGVGALITAPATASGLNPFRTLFTALFAQDWGITGIGDWPLTNGLLIILIQFAGAAICALIYMIFKDISDRHEELEAEEELMELFEIEEFELEEAPAYRSRNAGAKPKSIRSAGRKPAGRPAAKKAPAKRAPKRG